jgi:hypothetical protein
MSNDMNVPSNMRNTVRATALGLGALGIPGAFGAHADLVPITAAWATMLVTLASQAGREMDKDFAFKVAGGVIVAVGGFAAGVKTANTWLAWTGVGTLAAVLCNVGTNAALTYTTGMAAARVFLIEDKSASASDLILAIIRMIRGGGYSPA